MKTYQNLLLVASLAVLGLTTYSCDNTETTDPVADKSLIVSSLVEENAVVETKSLTAYIFVPTDSLTQVQIDGLLFMREEEKLAYDVYTSFFTAYGLSIFDKIADSELRHTTKVLDLLTFYGLTDPALAGAGLFSNPDLQQLYTDLIAQGVDTLTALQVGALIEEVDIADLKELLLDTTNANLTAVYSNLLKGSYNHLKAFVKVLDSYGFTYVPQVLDATTYAEILAMPNPGHHGGQGNGHGGNGNQGGNGGTCPTGGTGSQTGGTNGGQSNGGGHGHGHGGN